MPNQDNDEYAGMSTIDGIVDTNGEIDSDTFTSRFVTWIESNGWSFAGGIGPFKYEEEK